MVDFEKDYFQNFGQEIEVRNESVVKDNDHNVIFGNNGLDDVLRNIEEELFSDDPFPTLSNLPSLSLSSPSSSSALHWPYQQNQILESNMHPNPDALQLGPNNPVQEPGLFDGLDLLDPKDGFDDFSMLPGDCFVNHQDPDIPKIDQPSKLIEGNGSGGANAISKLATPAFVLAPVSASAPDCTDPDLGKMLLDWLKFNRDSISREDLRNIKLKKSTVDSAFAQLGSNKEGKKKLVQLVLTWVQEHKLRKKKHPQIEIPNCPNPYSEDYQLPHMCVNNQTVANPNNLGDCNSQPNWNMQENAGMAGNSSATEEARKRRMERKRRLSALYRHKRNDNKTVCEIGVGSSNRFCKYDNKLHYLRTNWQKLQNGVNPNPVKMTPTIVNVQNSIATFVEKRKARTTDMKFLFQKMLKQSDVSSLGRIVLPKKEAEKHLPMLEERVRISMQMDDVNLFCAWYLFYRFWPNNNSRIYVLENTGGFVRSNELQEGDIVAVYLNVKNDRYMIRGLKMRHKEAVETCADQTVEKDHQKIYSDKKNKTIIKDFEVDNYLIEIPSDSAEE